MSEDPFGFSQASKPKPPADALAEKLADVKPKPLSPEGPVEAIDRVADRRGFRSREAAPPAPEVRRRKGEAGPFVAINTRAPVRVADPFIAWCEKERYSYWQGIEELMRRAGLLK